MRYRVTRNEIVLATYWVDAEDKEDAITKVQEGGGDFLGDAEYLDDVEQSYDAVRDPE